MTEISITQSLANIENIFTREGAGSASGMAAISALVEQARVATTGDAISRIMAQLSGVINAELKAVGSQVRVNAHHIDRVAENVPTFLATKRGRVYVSKGMKNKIASDVAELKPLSAKGVEERKSEILSLLRSQMLDDSMTSIEDPLEEVDMVVTEAGPHRLVHAAERREAAAAKAAQP